MSPLMIQIAIWYHCRVGDYGKDAGDRNFNAPAVQEAIREFVLAGLLRGSCDGADGDQEYFATDGLKVYVEALCAVPWPEQKWVIPKAANAA